MNYRKYIAAALTAAILSSLWGCSGAKKPGNGSVLSAESTTEALIPPEPAEADDPNAITFDDGDFSFAKPVTTDPDSAQGKLEIGEFNGNKMLRFTDDGKAAADKLVQKIQIDAAKLLAPEDLAKVRSIEFDIYADATASDLVTDDATGVKAPGWIGGGGGANVSGDKWYDFAEFAGGEYNFEMSGATHVTFKFLLAAGGLCWSDDMEEAIFLIMRWGVANEGNMYVDNIVFYDETGSSLPITKASPAEDDTDSDKSAPEKAAAEVELAEDIIDSIEDKYASAAEEFPED